MLLCYVSAGTKNTERLVESLEQPCIDLATVDTTKYLTNPISEPFMLFVPSYEDNPYMDELMDVLDGDMANKNCVGIVGTGNLNFGDLFLVTAKELSEKYNVPIIRGVEFFGTPTDVQELKYFIKKEESTID